jgi:urease subunit alpha
MGDPNASIPTPQPVHYRPMFGAFGKAFRQLPELRQPGGARRRYRRKLGLRAALVPVRAAAASARPTCASTTTSLQMEVDPQTYEVRADGELLTCEPATSLPMAQRYFLF